MSFLTLLDCFGALCGFVATGLSSQNDIRHWPISIMSFVLYGIIFASIGMYGNSLVQFLLLAMSFVGWKNWSSDTSVIRWASTYELMIALCMGLLGGGIIVLLQVVFSHLNWEDALSAAFLFISIYALGQRYIQVWMLFFCLDVYFCIVMLQSGLYFSAAKYLSYLFFAQQGYFKWYSQVEQDRSFNNKHLSSMQPSCN
ncbi:MAG: nicotinamide mononucleotide transporter family protein [Pseudomonadota bacterium]|nr:nicotinamide mononucleotide transporter family protein [Pseudomonadota bacterium]